MLFFSIPSLGLQRCNSFNGAKSGTSAAVARTIYSN
jgi:hypothetical protein